MAFHVGDNFPEFSEFQKSLKNLQKALEPKFQALSKSLEQAVQPTLKKIGRQFETAVQEQLKPLQQALQKWIEIHLELSENIEVLANYGWYLSSNFIDELQPVNLLNDIKTNNFDQVEEKIIQLFQMEKEHIKQRLLNKYPDRNSIINLIFELHEEERYLASIPLCYAQADGISNKNWGVDFFSGLENGDLKIYKEIKGEEKSILDILINQLSIRNEQNEYEGNLQGPIETTSNRHKVMHGHSLEYGTTSNSIKAILILDFLQDLERFWDNYSTENE